MKTIGGMFGRSPYGPLHELAVKVQQCAEQVTPLLEVWGAGDRDALLERASEIDRLETEADVVKREIRDRLSTSMFSAGRAERVKDVTKHLDDVADAARRVARHAAVRATLIPKPLAAGLSRLGDLSIQAAARLTCALAQLRDAAAAEEAAAFQKALADLDGIDELRNRAGDIQEELLRTLFFHEREMDALSAVFLMRVIESIETMAERADNAAEALRRLAADAS